MRREEEEEEEMKAAAGGNNKNANERKAGGGDKGLKGEEANVPRVRRSPLPSSPSAFERAPHANMQERRS